MLSRLSLHHNVAVSAAILTIANSGACYVSPNTTTDVHLSPRQSSISALDCTLQAHVVQCCQTFSPLEDVANVIGPILSGLGISLPGLGTLVAFDCQDTVLGLGCSQSTLCCTFVVPEQNIGLNCEPVEPIL